MPRSRYIGHIAGDIAVSRRWMAMGLALFFGVLGLQWFYLGRLRRGFLYAGLGLIGISLYLGVVDVFRWALLSDAEFERRYARGPARWQHQKSRLNRVQAPISAAVDAGVDHLRHQWQAGVYDPRPLAQEQQSDHGSHDAPAINPATGLPMVGGIGGLDTSGHRYGTGFEQDTQMSWPIDNAPAYSRGDDHSFNRWEP